MSLHYQWNNYCAQSRFDRGSPSKGNLTGKKTKIDSLPTPENQQAYSL